MTWMTGRGVCRRREKVFLVTSSIRRLSLSIPSSHHHQPWSFFASSTCVSPVDGDQELCFTLTPLDLLWERFAWLPGFQKACLDCALAIQFSLLSVTSFHDIFTTFFTSLPYLLAVCGLLVITAGLDTRATSSTTRVRSLVAV